MATRSSTDVCQCVGGSKRPFPVSKWLESLDGSETCYQNNILLLKCLLLNV